MPFKHAVTDSRGKVHKRTSAERQYAFAIVWSWTAHEFQNVNGGITKIPAGSAASWSSRMDLAQKEAAKLRQRFADNNGSAVEIIPVTPVAIGRHLIK